MSERLLVLPEVRDALEARRAVVALETSVLAHGLPPPRNLEAADAMAGAIRAAAAIPAWISVEGGAIRVGTTEDRLHALASGRGVAKVARRDLPAAVAGGGAGATTVSATLWAAHRAGIEVAATGGIGGVHPRSGDVSADLLELARTPGLLVCSGPKSIVDPAATMERLEELGVMVLGYRCHRLPFFLSGETEIELEHRADSPAEAAGVARAARDLNTPSAVLLCNPISAELGLPLDEVLPAVQACEELAEARRVSGKDLTPFLLSCLAERTGGRSLEANLALLEANASLAAHVAVALAAGS
jgi:pseudouridylate synthase